MKKISPSIHSPVSLSFWRGQHGNRTDRLTWWLEFLPVGDWWFYSGLFHDFRLILTALHMCVLFVGETYTYARVPLFDWLRRHRNHYDRLGHIIPLSSRAVRLHILKRTSWQPFLLVAFALPLALYTNLEWWTALLSSDAAISFLGTQATLGIRGRHVLCPARRYCRPRFVAGSGSRFVMNLAKYLSVFNIGLQNTFVYRWNYFLRALFGLIPLPHGSFSGAPSLKSRAVEVLAATITAP